MRRSGQVSGALFLTCLILFSTGCGTDPNPDFTEFSPHPFGAEGHKAYFNAKNDTPDLIKSKLAQCYGCHTPPGNTVVENKVTGAPSCAECHNPSANAPLGCNSCHGNSAVDPAEPWGWAPPQDLSGGMVRSLKGVGAHQAHLNGSTGLFARVECGVCHTVPTNWDRKAHFKELECITCHQPTPRWDRGHMVDATPGKAEVQMGFPATKRGRTPAYDPATGTCSSVWCHGTYEPVWTSTAPFTDCAVCHGYNPVRDTYGTHPRTTSVTQCYTCHRLVVDSGGNIIRPDMHADGVIQF